MLKMITPRILAYTFYFIPHHAISWLMNKISRIQNKSFKNFAIKIYTNLNPVNMSEAVIENMFAFESLNAFFTRELKPESRPLDADTDNWICPVDGSVSQAGDIKDGQIFQAKGHEYSLIELLGGDRKKTEPYQNGKFATLYLSPRDYHRIHMPITGALTNMTYVPGRLFSVAAHTVNNIPRLFARNERCVCHFETEQGPMALILVGAINVSAIETTWHGLVNPPDNKIFSVNYEKNKTTLNRGEEMGRFNLGSTVIVLTPSDFEWDKSIEAEKIIRLGQKLCRRTIKK